MTSEQLLDEILADVPEEFNYDHFHYLVKHGTPQIGGGVEDQKAREFLERSGTVSE
jgi:hypothetical protein